MKSRKIGLLGAILIPTQIALGVTLVAFGFFVYINFSMQLYRSMDAVLKSKTEGLIESIDVFWRLGGKDRNARAEFAEFAKAWVTKKPQDGVFMNSVVQISVADGTVVATTHDVTFWPTKALRTGSCETIEARLANGRSTHLRVYARDVPEKNSPGYRIIVGQPTLLVEGSENNLRDALLLFIPGMLLFLAFSITVIARHELRPLNDIVQNMGRIGVRNLDERIPFSGGTREIAALKKSYDTMLGRLERAFTEQQAFIADLSHQIKTPLAILKGLFDTTLRRERSGAEYREALESGLEEIDTITSLIEKLLLIARYDNLEMKPEFRQIDLAAEVRDLAEVFDPLARSRGIALELSLEPAEILGDQTMIRQAFVNLLENAIKYATPETVITVTLRRALGAVRLAVRDFGAVIAADEIPHLFERFRRFDRTGAQGFGLGLSIVDSIARQHGARVEVTSDAALGTEFVLVFPVGTMSQR
jgi:heavy metal sensor kinase